MLPVKVWVLLLAGRYFTNTHKPRDWYLCANSNSAATTNDCTSVHSIHVPIGHLCIPYSRRYMCFRLIERPQNLAVHTLQGNIADDGRLPVVGRRLCAGNRRDGTRRRRRRVLSRTLLLLLISVSILSTSSTSGCSSTSSTSLSHLFEASRKPRGSGPSCARINIRSCSINCSIS